MIIKTFFSIFMLILISLYKERNQTGLKPPDINQNFLILPDTVFTLAYLQKVFSLGVATSLAVASRAGAFLMSEAMVVRRDKYFLKCIKSFELTVNNCQKKQKSCSMTG